VTIGRSEDVPEGVPRQFDAGGRKVAVYRLGGALFAMDGVCPHRGGPVGEGTVENGIAVCPWHGWRFEVKSGKCVNAPGVAQTCFPVREESGAVIVEV
jgi:nitrite reductase (NADH) small subunit